MSAKHSSDIVRKAGRWGVAVEKVRKRFRRKLWAYAYDIVPAQPSVRLGAVRLLLDAEHAAALQAKRTWTGQVVCETAVTRILIVTDSPDQHRAINRRLEGQLTHLNARFNLTQPLSLRPV